MWHDFHGTTIHQRQHDIYISKNGSCYSFQQWTKMKLHGKLHILKSPNLMNLMKIGIRGMVANETTANQSLYDVFVFGI